MKELKTFRRYIKDPELNVMYFVTKLYKKCSTDYVPLKTSWTFFLPTYRIRSFQISTLKLNFQSFATPRDHQEANKSGNCLLSFLLSWGWKKNTYVIFRSEIRSSEITVFKLKLEWSTCVQKLLFRNLYWCHVEACSRYNPQKRRQGKFCELAVFRDTFVAECLP